MFKRIFAVLAVVLGFAVLTPALASAHEDYFPASPGDHYGHWVASSDNVTVLHPGTSPTWNGYPDTTAIGTIKYVPMEIGDGYGFGCGTSTPLDGNVAAYINDVLFYETGHTAVYNDGRFCYNIYTFAAVQDLQRFFGVTVDGRVTTNDMDLLDLLASNG